MLLLTHTRPDLLKKSLFYLQTTRNLTGPEVSNALRPFYFLVHPDLFGRHPAAQAQNEKSLQTLTNYVDTLVTERKRPNPKDVTFFIKPRTKEEKEKAVLRSVRIRLKEANIRGTVMTILNQVGLPTGYVDKIPKQSDQSSKEKDRPVYEDSDEGVSSTVRGFSATDTKQPFTRWLNTNIQKARARFAECEPIRLETERLQGELCYKYEMKDILWDCGWDALNRRGAVEAFNYLATQHPHIQGLVKGRNLVFGKSSGMSVNGDIILYSGEVRRNWLNVLNNATQSEKLLKFLPMYQKALSQSLLDIELVLSTNDTTIVEEYRTRIRKLVTTLADFKRRNQFPDSWPSNLSEYRMSVESDACSFMLSPEGTLMIPASSPAFLIIDFISGSIQDAKRRMDTNVSLQQEEGKLITMCMNELGLIQLDRDESITAHQMIVSCKSMLGNAGKLRHLTHGSHFIVARYYMVKSDGVICIPWDLTFGDEEPRSSHTHHPIKHLALY